MSPLPSTSDTLPDAEVNAGERWSMKEIWYSIVDWVVRFAHSINEETLEHPYFISFALIVLWAWPHMLMLPVWFGKDAYRRMDDHARTALNRATAPARRRRRDAFFSTYRSVVNASYEPHDTARPPLFGGTPLTDGDFSYEEERHLPVPLRVIRWIAILWAAFILGRELYFVFERY